MIFVEADIRLELVVMFVLTVPLLVRVLCSRTGFRRGDTETNTEPAFSLITEPRRRR